ncbi:MAG: hypothetical protein IJV29_14490 [Butyrivibrio sp.]|nr:hypothetical protein [Butyrivibrio sp.]
MKKRLLSVLMAGVMSAALLTGCGSGSTSQEAETAVEAVSVDTSVLDALREKYGSDVFEADANYDEYTIVEYTIESAGATFAATVSRKSDKSEYQVHCMFYGDEQLSVWNGKEVTEDKTGFMETDTPLIVEAAEAQGIWVSVN